MEWNSAYESSTEYSDESMFMRKECAVCGTEIEEQHESILFECERCMNLQDD